MATQASTYALPMTFHSMHHGGCVIVILCSTTKCHRRTAADILALLTLVNMACGTICRALQMTISEPGACTRAENWQNTLQKLYRLQTL